MHREGFQKDGTYRVETKSALRRKDAAKLGVFTVLWFAANTFFWGWWLDGEVVANTILHGLFSVCSFYTISVLPGMYLFYLWNMRNPLPVQARTAQDMGVVTNVAMISLTVPGSEDLSFVERQLAALRAVRYPHDSWILVDKFHSPEIQCLAERYGVFYFCRHDIETWGEAQVAAWNTPEPPFKAKTKAGNVNSWLDAYGGHYSHFTQLDIDHKPRPGYLDKVLGYFVDPTVKWVQAPSVYNNDTFWTARGSLKQEGVLQWILQRGFFGFARTPMIIGSHCTYDTAAILEIGGFQPTRAEDHLDTVLLSSKGYTGVFVPQVIAVGDGPETFETYLGQQFAWAYSLMQIMFDHTPSLLKTYGLRQAVQFLFAQTWYPLWSLSMLVLFLIPALCLLTQQSISTVSYFEFMVRSLPLAVVSFLIWRFSQKWMHPESRGITWPSIVLHIARWPIVLSALIQVLLRVEKSYMITPKGVDNKSVSLRAHGPYFGLMAINLMACWIHLTRPAVDEVSGYLFFALQGNLFMLAILITTLAFDWANLRSSTNIIISLAKRAKHLTVLAIIIAVFVTTSSSAMPKIISSWFGNQGQATDYERTMATEVDPSPVLSDILAVGND